MKNLCFAFLDLEKAFDQVPRDVHERLCGNVVKKSGWLRLYS